MRPDWASPGSVLLVRAPGARQVGYTAPALLPHVDCVVCRPPSRFPHGSDVHEERQGQQ